MDWKQEAIEKLRGYEARRQLLENIPLELERLKNAYGGIRSVRLDGMPITGSSSTREDFMLNNITRRDELRRELKEAELWVSVVEGGLSVLDDDGRTVLDLFYIHPAKGNVDRLCERLSVEKSAVYVRRDKALRHFTLALYGALESV